MGNKSEGTNYMKFIKPRQFQYGENFKQFCERFKQYTEMNEITENLDKIFLSLVDNRTFAKLNEKLLEVGSDKDCDKLIKCYIEIFYPSSNQLNLISNLMSLKQEKFETIDDFEYRLTQVSSRIDGDPNDKIKLTAFINGLRNPALKAEIRKDCELGVNKYSEIINLAKNIENFNKESEKSECDTLNDVFTNKINFRNDNEREGRDRQLVGRPGHSSDGIRGKQATECWECGKRGHRKSECYSKSGKNYRNFESANSGCKNLNPKI